jgi:hypothetical protein
MPMSDAWTSGVIGVAVLNVVLTAALALQYGRMYTRTKAPFTLGLILFALAFLAQNVLVAYAYAMMMPLFGVALMPYLLGIGACEAVGLAAVLWTATR